jgi:hypothetical protein
VDAIILLQDSLACTLRRAARFHQPRTGRDHGRTRGYFNKRDYFK